MNDSGIEGNTILRRNIRPILQIIMLSLLLWFKVKSCQSAEVLLADGFIYCSSSLYPFTIIISRICPPVSFLFHITQNHIFNRARHSWNLPGNVGLPTSPCLSEVLHDGFCFVCFDSFRHHIHNIFHHCSPQLQVIMGFCPLLCNHLHKPLRMSSFKLPGQQISKPSLKKRNDSP